jgi:hypothetical protein
MERFSFIIFFMSLLYTLYQGVMFYLFYQRLNKKNVFLGDIYEKILLLISVSYLLTTIFIGINI